MLIDFQITLGIDGEIEQPVFGEQRQHVIEEPDTRADIRHARAVEVQLELNLGFVRLATDRVCARHGIP